LFVGRKGGGGRGLGCIWEEKLKAEKHLRASGLDYTILRPGGLKSDAPAGPLYVR
jgi:hypothetical protein